MQKLMMAPKELPGISAKLLRLVLSEVKNRLRGNKKWCPNETLEQIVLNKYTVIELEKKRKYLSK